MGDNENSKLKELNFTSSNTNADSYSLSLLSAEKKTTSNSSAGSEERADRYRRQAFGQSRNEGYLHNSMLLRYSIQ